MADFDDETPDAALIDRLRAGDREAAVDLWTRHYPSVLMAARRVTRQPRDAEEIASDAFSGMLSALSGGAGPKTSVRAYLVTSVRNLAASRATRCSAGEVMTDDVALFERPTVDTTAHMSELQLVRVAFSQLPARWQIVLWRTAVDKDSNIEVGRAMGLSPNGVAALAKRARRGFRQSYLRAHLSDRGVEAQCKPFIDGLADLSISESDGSTTVRAHVAGCVPCTDRIAELRAVNLNFAGVLGPAVFALVPSKLLFGTAGAGVAGDGHRRAAGGAGGGGGRSSAPAGPPGNVLGFRPGARWALGSAALAGAAVAILVAARPEVMIVPQVAPTLSSTTTAFGPLVDHRHPRRPDTQRGHRVRSRRRPPLRPGAQAQHADACQDHPPHAAPRDCHHHDPAADEPADRRPEPRRPSVETRRSTCPRPPRASTARSG